MKLLRKLRLMKEIYGGGRPIRKGRPWGAWSRYRDHCRARFWWYKWFERIDDAWTWFTTYAWDKPRDLLWWFRYRLHPRHRYHVIKPRTLKPGYHCQSSQILHSIFECVVSYVEENVSNSFEEKGIKLSALKHMTKTEIINHFFALQGNYKTFSNIAALCLGEEERTIPFEEFGSVDRLIVDNYIWWTREYWDEAKDDPPTFLNEPPDDLQPSVDAIMRDNKRELYPEYYAYLDRLWEYEARMERETKKRMVQLAAIYKHLCI